MEPLTLAFGALLLVCLVAVVVLLRRVRAAPKPQASVGPPPDTDSKLVAREVRDEGGRRVGETVRVEGDEVVVKQEGAFLMVAKANLHEDADKLRAEGVDWDAARAKGEAWRQRQEDVMRYDEKGLPIPGR
jgi:hypothetical protein